MHKFDFEEIIDRVRNAVPGTPMSLRTYKYFGSLVMEYYIHNANGRHTGAIIERTLWLNARKVWTFRIKA